MKFVTLNQVQLVSLVKKQRMIKPEDRLKTLHIDDLTAVENSNHQDETDRIQDYVQDNFRVREISDLFNNPIIKLGLENSIPEETQQSTTITSTNYASDMRLFIQNDAHRFYLTPKLSLTQDGVELVQSFLTRSDANMNKNRRNRKYFLRIGSHLSVLFNLDKGEEKISTKIRFPFVNCLISYGENEEMSVEAQNKLRNLKNWVYCTDNEMNKHFYRKLYSFFKEINTEMYTTIGQNLYKV